MIRDDGSLPSISSSAVARKSKWLVYLQVGWALLRLIVLFGSLYFFKDWILNFLGDPERLTLLVIGIVSTPVVRLLLFLAFGALLTAVCYGATRAWPRFGYLGAMSAAALLSLALFYTSDTSLWRALPAIALVATNLLPDRLFARLAPTEAQRGYVIALAVGVAEIFFFRHFLSWVAELCTGRRMGAWGSLPAAAAAAFLASGAAAVLIHPGRIATIEQSLRMPAQARIVARGDFNWIAIGADERHLFATGHGVPRLLRYDTADFSLAPQAVGVDTGSAQAFAQDRQAGEIYIYNGNTRQLLTFDATALRVKNSFPVKGLASGDPWLAVEPRSNLIFIISEADIHDGAPFLALDRASGAVRDRRDLDAGNLLLVGDTSRLYMSFFRRRNRLMSYDVSTLAIDKDVAASPRVDRMAYLPDRREVLLTLPAAARIARYDADTLDFKGEIPAIFGVRTIAFDTTRRLMLCGSLATGEVAIIDLDTFDVRSRHYLGPWLRTIVVDPSKGVAYVSSNGSLYEFKYAARP